MDETEYLLNVIFDRGRTECPRCGEHKGRRAAYCDRCSKKRGKLLQIYGLEIEDYDAIFREQGGVCAICGRLAGERMLAVDHDHTTLQIRGLLCVACNRGLGFFQDDPDMMERATEYLRRGGIRTDLGLVMRAVAKATAQSPEQPLRIRGRNPARRISV